MSERKEQTSRYEANNSQQPPMCPYCQRRFANLDDLTLHIVTRHTQSGNTFTAPRLKDDAVSLKPEQLDAFVGEYQYGPAVMTVTRDASQLFAQLTGQPRFPIFPKSETEFEWRVVAANVRFVKGEDGKVTKAVHTQNGNTFDAPKIK